MTRYNESIAGLIARIILGILFFAHGYDKVFREKLAGGYFHFSAAYGIKEYS